MQRMFKSAAIFMMMHLACARVRNWSRSDQMLCQNDWKDLEQWRKGDAYSFLHGFGASIEDLNSLFEG